MPVAQEVLPQLPPLHLIVPHYGTAGQSIQLIRRQSTEDARGSTSAPESSRVVFVDLTDDLDSKAQPIRHADMAGPHGSNLTFIRGATINQNYHFSSATVDDSHSFPMPLPIESVSYSDEDQDMDAGSLD